MAGNPELPFKLIPRRAFGERLGICPRTVFRREHGEPDFPRPVVINRRNYFLERDVLAYEQRLAAGLGPGREAS
jgi:hypothetical protein